MDAQADTLDWLLYFARFLLGSTLLLGGVWLLERFGFLKHRDLSDLCWKAAVIASFALLLPPTASFAPQLTLQGSAGEYIQQMARPDNTVATRQPISQQSQPETTQPTPTKPPQSVGQAASIPTRNHQNTATSWQIPSWLLWPLIIAALALISLSITYFMAVRSLGQRTRVSADHQAFRLLFDICDKADIKATPYLTRTSRIDSPLCLPSGEICLPEWALNDLPDHELRGLIAHEVAHLKHNDPIKLLVLHALTRLFFLQPLFAVAQKRLADLAELAADEWAAGHSDNPKSVAQAIYACARQITDKQQPQWGLAMARDKSKLRARVERLLNAHQSNFKTTAGWAKLGAVAAIVAATLNVPALAIDTQPPKPTKAVKPVKPEAGSRSIHISRDKKAKGSVTTYTESGDGIEYKFTRKGKMALDDSGNRLGQLYGNGKLTLTETKDDLTRTIKYRNRNGELDVRFSEDGDSRDMTDADHAWADEMFLTYLRRSGDMAQQRVKAILANTDADTVMDEMDKLSEHALGQYANALLKQTDLNSDQLARMIAKLTVIQSDYSKRQAFTPLLSREQLGEAEQLALFDAIDSIASDYEMRSLLTEALEANGAVVRDNLHRMVKLAGTTIESDYELRIFLTSVAELLPDNTEALDIAISSLDSIESDYELRTAMTHIIDVSELNHDAWLRLIDTLSSVESDYEAAQLVIKMARTINDPVLLETLANRAKAQITSSHESRKVRKVLAHAMGE